MAWGALREPQIPSLANKCLEGVQGGAEGGAEPGPIGPSRGERPAPLCARIRPGWALPAQSGQGWEHLSPAPPRAAPPAQVSGARPARPGGGGQRLQPLPDGFVSGGNSAPGTAAPERPRLLPFNAGWNLSPAPIPAILHTGEGTALPVSCGHPSAGIHPLNPAGFGIQPLNPAGFGIHPQSPAGIGIQPPKPAWNWNSPP